jgi:hypothetical protein
MKLILIVSMVLPLLVVAGETQTANKIPYNSKGNIIALTVENTAGIAAKNISVEIDNPPKWLKFDTTLVVLNDIQSKKSKEAEFRFSIGRTAPVGKDQKINILIKSTLSDGLSKQTGATSKKPAIESWTKEITFTVEAPKEFHLFDNYPNPFNPSTTIAVELPKQSRIKIIVYDLLGRVLRELADETRDAGYVEYVWDGRNDHGTNVSSGMYFCRVSAGDWHAVKKMVMMK